MISSDITLRPAVLSDVPALEVLIDASIRVLGGRYYDAEKVESSLKYVFGADTMMIEDGTYVVVESEGLMIGAGGWSHRWTPFGGDQATPVRDAEYRKPGTDPAVIRAMYVHPDWARRGIGRLIIRACESAAHEAGFEDLELVATLSGVEFYERMGYTQIETIHYHMGNDTFIDFVRMEKRA